MGGHPKVADQWLYRTAECEVPQDCIYYRAGADHTCQSHEASTQSGIGRLPERVALAGAMVVAERTLLGAIVGQIYRK